MNIGEIHQNAPVRDQVFEGADSILSLAADWDDLFARAKFAPPYLSRTWVDTFVHEGWLQGTPLFISVWCGKKLVALFPLVVRLFLNVRIALPIGTGQPSYLGLLLDPEYLEVVEYVADIVISKRIFDVYCSSDLSSEDLATNDLLSRLTEKGYFCKQVLRNPCYYIRLGCCFDGYLKDNKSPKSRKKLRWKERKLCANKEVTEEYYSGTEVTQQVLKRVALVQQESWMKERGAAVLSSSFYQKLLLEMAKAGFGRVWLLVINREDVAFVYAFVAHKKLHYAWTAFKSKYATSFSVGMVLTMWTIRKACEEGVLWYDFGHGDAEYKRFWATGKHNVERVVVGRGFGGKLIVLFYVISWRLAKIKWLRGIYHRGRSNKGQRAINRSESLNPFGMNGVIKEELARSRCDIW